MTKGACPPAKGEATGHRATPGSFDSVACCLAKQDCIGAELLTAHRMPSCGDAYGPPVGHTLGLLHTLPVPVKAGNEGGGGSAAGEFVFRSKCQLLRGDRVPV